MLDRDLQRNILRALSGLYPEGTYDLPAAVEAATGTRPSDRATLVTMQYLQEHDLVISGYKRRGAISANDFIAIGEHTITARGLDFLADDGGLGAVLNVLTVRLDAQTLQALLAQKIEASQLPAEEKSRLKAALQTLGREAWSEVARRLATEALDHWPQAIAWLQTLRG